MPERRSAQQFTELPELGKAEACAAVARRKVRVPGAGGRRFFAKAPDLGLYLTEGRLEPAQFIGEDLRLQEFPDSGVQFLEQGSRKCFYHSQGNFNEYLEP